MTYQPQRLREPHLSASEISWILQKKTSLLPLLIDTILIATSRKMEKVDLQWHQAEMM